MEKSCPLKLFNLDCFFSLIDEREGWELKTQDSEWIIELIVRLF